MMVHYFGERVHNTEVVFLDNDMKMMYIEVVVLSMTYKALGMVGKD